MAKALQPLSDTSVSPNRAVYNLRTVPSLYERCFSKYESTLPGYLPVSCERRREQPREALRHRPRRLSGTMSAGWQLRLADGATQDAVARCDALCQLPTNHQGAKLGSLEGLCKGFLASARFFDSQKKKHFNARYLIAHILTHEGHSSAVPLAWFADKRPDSRDFRKLLHEEPETAVSLPAEAQLIASEDPLPAELIATATEVPTAASVPAALEVTADTRSTQTCVASETSNCRSPAVWPAVVH